MAFGVSYQIVGRADCPYFARAERLAQMLKHSLSLNDRDIIVNMVSPSQWASHSSSLASSRGPAFVSFLQAQESSDEPDKEVLVFHPRTNRLIGGEKAFRKEVARKYGLECDVGFGQLRAMARENFNSCDAIAKAREIRALVAPLLVAVVGPAGVGKSTLARKLAAQYNLVRVSTGEMLRRIALGAAPPKDGGQGAEAASALSEEDVAVVRDHMLRGELVPDRLVLPLLRARLSEDDVRRRGAVLDGVPRTAAQANAVRDLEGSVGHTVVVRLHGVDDATLRARLAGRRVDPLTGDLFNVSAASVLPDSALVLERLVVRWGDQQPQADGQADSSAAQLRHYAQHIDDVLPVFDESFLRLLDARGSIDEVYERLVSTVEPLAQSVMALRIQGAALMAAQERSRGEAGALDSLDGTPAASPALKSTPRASPPAPHTPDTVAFSVLPELPSSRRNSLGAQQQQQLLASSASVGVLPSSRTGSRRGSLTHQRRSSAGGALDAKGVAHMLLEKQSGSGSRQGSRPGSKTGSRRASLTNLSAPFSVGGGGPNRRISARASGQGALPLQQGMLNSTAAPASSLGSKRASGTGVPAAAASAVSTSSSKAASKRASGSDDTVPFVMHDPAELVASISQVPSGAAASSGAGSSASASRPTSASASASPTAAADDGAATPQAQELSDDEPLSDDGDEDPEMNEDDVPAPDGDEEAAEEEEEGEEEQDE